MRLAGRPVLVSYPSALDPWFAGIVEPAGKAGRFGYWVRLRAGGGVGAGGAGGGDFTVATSAGWMSERLSLGDALSVFWERVGFLLVSGLEGAMAVHGAAVSRGKQTILLPGKTGSGKTHLCLWLRARGYGVESDDVFVLGARGRDGRKPTLEGALARPVFLKPSADWDGLVPGVEPPALRLASATGELWKFDGKARAKRRRRLRSGLIVFARFERGERLHLRALTAGEAGLRLMENCLNARNLDKGGLPLAAAAARGLRAIELRYGDNAQLEGGFDPLLRQVLATNPGSHDLATLCDIFSAAATRSTAAEPAAPAEPAAAMPRGGAALFPLQNRIHFEELQEIREHHYDFHSLPAVLDEEECRRIVRMSQNIEMLETRAVWGAGGEGARSTDLFWIDPNRENLWLFQKIATAVSRANKEHFSFSLDGEILALQLGRYGVGQGYDWHDDVGVGVSRRKLSVVVHLTDPVLYDGGRLGFFQTEKESAYAPRDLGSMTVFPSFVLHRAEKITRGERWSLVTWLEGPPFR